MSKMQQLNVFLRERLTAAAVEIFGKVEKTIIEYEDEISRSKEENERLQKLLDLVIKPQIKLHRAESSETHISKEELPVEQDWRSPLLQPESREDQELRTSLDVEPLQDAEPDGHHIEFVFNPPGMKGLDQDPWPSHLFQAQNMLDAETNNLPSNLVEHMKTEPEGGEGYGVQPSSPQLLFDPDAHSSAALTGNPNGPQAGGLLQWKSKRGRPFRNRIGTLSELIKRRASYERFRCHVCGKGFPARKGLADHMTTHTGERPHSCHHCGKGFKVKSHLNEHIRVHTGEKPFVCPVCGKAFRQDAHMKGHLRRTHKEMPYRCHDCGESFSQMGELQVHRTVCCGPRGLSF
ncbi:hypothetical protein UPYG_G00162320 [Umbra pygmaea]|uniref:C2H2-type domain-containing protein n=1 Tax=Umbra pygmaea TaxID=75934 RepID=A0ABD0X9R0_UMBPY